MSWLGRELSAFWQVLRDAPRLFWLAPLAVALVMVPEFVQHVAEIRLGMFESKAAFQAHAMDAARWYFGYAKLTGLPLAVLFCARFWANRERGQRWWSFAGIAWKPLALGFLVQVVCSVPGMFGLDLPQQVSLAIGLVLTIISLPGLVLIVAGLLGDRGLSLQDAYVRGWGKAVRILVYIGPVWFALQMLHEWDHHAALGSAPALVWSLMVWDTAVVGMMAALAGTGLHHGYIGPRINPQEG